MARHSIPKSGATSRFRMVVIDAELQEGEISQLAPAIQGAFNGQRAPAVRLNGSTAKSLPSPDPGEIPAELNGAEVFEDVGAAVTAPTPTRPKAQKKIRTPDLDADLHPGTDPSFRAYADARNVTAATSVLKKFPYRGIVAA